MARYYFVLLIVLMMQINGNVMALDEESRAHLLFQDIRCLVCNGQTIADSDSDFAKMLRQDIMLSIKDGKSNEAIKQELSDRYGGKILLDHYPWFMVMIFPILFIVVVLIFCISSRTRF